MPAIDYDSFQYYTYDDYKNWEERYELIDGIAYAMSPAPYPKHQRVALKITRELGDNLKCDRKECEVYISPVDWKIDENTVVQPDVALFCEVPEGEFFSKTPPLVVEVLSKATALKDVTTKKELYEKSGVLFYIIVEPHTEVVDIYRLTDEKYLHIGKYTKEDQYSFELSESCSSKIDFSNVF